MSVITYQYRIKDSTSHKQLARMGWSVNFVWNFCNEVSMLALRRDGKWLTAYDLHKLTAGCSKALGLQGHTIQKVCSEYVTRRRQFRRRRLAWRSKKRSLGWIPFDAGAIRVEGDAITYYGHTFRFWLSREIQGTIKTGSFTEDARGRWYVNLQCEVPDEPQQKLGLNGVGIDLGLSDQIACSDGPKHSRANITCTYADQLGMAQRAGKKKRAQALHAKIRNKRKDWSHKVTTEIARRAEEIVVGNVSSSRMARTNFAKSTYDSVWYQIRGMLAYKGNRLGVRYSEVNESFTTVTCSVCLARSGPRGLGDLVVREWTCNACGTRHDRDVNAARNILRAGRRTPIKGIPVL